MCFRHPACNITTPERIRRPPFAFTDQNLFLVFVCGDHVQIRLRFSLRIVAPPGTKAGCCKGQFFFAVQTVQVLSANIFKSRFADISVQLLRRQFAVCNQIAVAAFNFRPVWKNEAIPKILAIVSQTINTPPAARRIFAERIDLLHNLKVDKGLQIFIDLGGFL